MEQDAFKGRSTVITGGLGFIGSNLAHRLVGLGAKVVLIDNLFPNHGSNRANIRGIEDRVDLHILDMRDSEALRGLLDGVEFVFNLAGQTSHLDSMHDPVTDLEMNVSAQLVLLEGCRGRCPGARIVYASTRQIYGRPQYLPVDERHLLRPVDVNGVNKMAGEAHHIVYNDVYGLRSTALRLTNTYGPRMRVRDARQTFLGLWIRKALEGEPYEVWGGAQLRDLAYVDDVVDALMHAALCPDLDGAPFNVSGSPALSLLELAQMLERATGQGFAIREFPEERKRIDIGDYYADDSRFRELTGWAPQVSLQEGLERTLAYFRDHLSDYV